MKKPTKCKIDGCFGTGNKKYGHESFVKGFCDKHYQRFKKYGDPNITTKYHGITKHPYYETWRNMKQRCSNKNRKDYKNYGGKGVKVCNKWKNDFQQFCLDMGTRPDGYLLDRIDYNGNYEPKNCRWVSVAKSSRNKSTNNWIDFNGTTNTIGDWSKKLGGHKSLIRTRLKQGWSIEKAITTSVNSKLQRRYPSP